MKRIGIMMVLALAIVAVIAVAAHHEGEELIALDKEWGAAAPGEAAVSAIKKIIADDAVVISGTGIVSKADMIEEAAQPDDSPAGPYMADHFSVKMLSDDIAVMTHHAGDPDPHWSMHVWQKKDGGWQVVASATVPVEEAD